MDELVRKNSRQCLLVLISCAIVVICYIGESFDSLQTDNELSMLLMNKAADSIGYNFDSWQKLRNRVNAKIR